MLSEKFELDSPPVIRNTTQEELAEHLRDEYLGVWEGLSDQSKNRILSENRYAARERFSGGSPFLNARDYLALYDLPGLAKEWRGFDVRHKDEFMIAAADIEKGDTDAAQEIEKMMAAIEAPILLTTGAVTRDGVDGAVPNVPAFIQGNPFNMRTRRRDMTGRGPISLFIETTTSSSFFWEDRIRRIAALLSFARLLSLQRPVNLWFCATYGGKTQLTQAAVRIDTTPLDIARVVPLISHMRSLNITPSIIWKGKVKGSWAYDVPTLERKFAGEILGRVVSPGSQIAYIGASMLTELEEVRRSPEKWVVSMLKKFSPHLIDGTERDENFGEVA